MTYIDAGILNLIEWSCQKLQLLTGRTNVWFALQLTNLSIIVYFVWAGVYFWSSDAVPRILIALFCGGLLYVLMQTVFRVPIETYEQNAYRRVAKGFRNPRRVRDALLRISFLTLSVLLCYPVVLVYVHLREPVVLLTYSLIVLTTVVLYLLACDPLPPCRGRIREWRHSLAGHGAAHSDARGGGPVVRRQSVEVRGNTSPWHSSTSKTAPGRIPSSSSHCVPTRGLCTCLTAGRKRCCCR